jgi:hypothetical protein
MRPAGGWQTLQPMVKSMARVEIKISLQKFNAYLLIAKR